MTTLDYAIILFNCLVVYTSTTILNPTTKSMLFLRWSFLKIWK